MPTNQKNYNQQTSFLSAGDASSLASTPTSFSIGSWHNFNGGAISTRSFANLSYRCHRGSWRELAAFYALHKKKNTPGKSAICFISNFKVVTFRQSFRWWYIAEWSLRLFGCIRRAKSRLCLPSHVTNPCGRVGFAPGPVIWRSSWQVSSFGKGSDFMKRSFWWYIKKISLKVCQKWFKHHSCGPALQFCSGAAELSTVFFYYYYFLSALGRRESKIRKKRERKARKEATHSVQ